MGGDWSDGWQEECVTRVDIEDEERDLFAYHKVVEQFFGHLKEPVKFGNLDVGLRPLAVEPVRNPDHSLDDGALRLPVKVLALFVRVLSKLSVVAVGSHHSKWLSVLSETASG